MQEAAGDDVRIVRVMPNTPCLVGETASAMCLGGQANDEDAETVRTLFSAVGRIVQVGCWLMHSSHHSGAVLSPPSTGEVLADLRAHAQSDIEK